MFTLNVLHPARLLHKYDSRQARSSLSDMKSLNAVAASNGTLNVWAVDDDDLRFPIHFLFVLNFLPVSLPLIILIIKGRFLKTYIPTH